MPDGAGTGGRSASGDYVEVVVRREERDYPRRAVRSAGERESCIPDERREERFKPRVRLLEIEEAGVVILAVVTKASACVEVARNDAQDALQGFGVPGLS